MCPVYRGVVQLVRTLVLGTRGRGFEFRHPDKRYRKAAQMHLRCRVRQNAPKEAHDESVVQMTEHSVTTCGGCKLCMALIILDGSFRFWAGSSNW